MLNRIVKRLTGDWGPESEQIFAEQETSQAVAALLVHAARIDGVSTADEEAQLKDLLAQRFGLQPAALGELIAGAGEAEREAVDLYRFTSVLTKALDQKGRKKVVEMLWTVAFVDGVLHEFEDNLVWRVAELLGVSTRDRMILKKKVLGESGAA